jgi:hypothetical protein
VVSLVWKRLLFSKNAKSVYNSQTNAKVLIILSIIYQALELGPQKYWDQLIPLPDTLTQRRIDTTIAGPCQLWATSGLQVF